MLYESALTSRPKITAHVCIAVSVVLGLALRFFLLPNVSGDMQAFLIPWLHTIREIGERNALGGAFSNYNPPYLYLLSLASLLPDQLPEFFIIKLPSILFDLLAAFFMLRIVALRYRSPLVQALAVFLTLVTPTVLLNSSMWGQCDVVYSTLLLGATYYLCIRQGHWAAVCFGIALSFKLQALFFAPVLVVALLRREMRPWHIALTPLVYVIALFPAAAAGRPFAELFSIYFQQAEYYRSLAPNSPTIYTWFSDGNIFQQTPDKLYDLLVPFGLMLGASFALVWVVLGTLSRKRMSAQSWVLLTYVCMLGLPYLLPKMHDRYFFPADLMSVAVVFLFPRLFWIAIVQQLVSLSVYTNVLGFHPLLEIKSAALLAGILLILVMREAALHFYGQKHIEEAIPRQLCGQPSDIKGWPVLSGRQALYGVTFSGLLLLLAVAGVHQVSIDRVSLSLPVENSTETSPITPDRVMWTWRPSRGGVNLFDQALVVKGTQYDSGFAVHANGRLVYDLPNGVAHFTAQVAVPDYMSTGAPTSLFFALYGDGKPLWKSFHMHPGVEPQTVDISVAGVRRLTLAILDADDGDYGDHGYWLNPKISLAAAR